MLHGTTVPAHWETVEAVLEVLSDLGGKDPDTMLDWEGDKASRR